MLAGDNLYGKLLFTWLSLVMSSLMVSSLCCPFSHEISWMRSGTELSQFLRICLLFLYINSCIFYANSEDSVQTQHFVPLIWEYIVCL